MRPTTPPDIPAFGLIVIGDEILSGKRADKHMPKVIELLAARGLSLSWCEYVGDTRERITAVLKRAFNSGDVVFSTGGIGATPDDHTRQCAAAAVGLPLVLHPEAENLIRQRMQELAIQQGTVYEPEHPDNIHRLNMGMFPQGAQLVPNPYNKIPGFWLGAGPPQASSAPSGGSDPHAVGECGGTERSAGPPQASSAPSGGSDPHAVGECGGTKRSAGPPQASSAPSGGSDPHAVGERGGTIFFVPGFPVMAWPMIEWVLDTHFAQFAHRAVQVEKSVIVFGAMEAALTPLMEQIEREHSAVKVFSLPSVDHPQHGRHIELGVKGLVGDVSTAYEQMLAGLAQVGAKLGPEMAR
jgi:molybdopterin-biosynthesis enzyme MoeA-like protein